MNPIAKQFADLLEPMIPKLKEPPQQYYNRRVMRLVIEDECDAGGSEIDYIELEEGDAELLLEALREKEAR